MNTPPIYLVERVSHRAAQPAVVVPNMARIGEATVPRPWPGFPYEDFGIGGVIAVTTMFGGVPLVELVVRATDVDYTEVVDGIATIKVAGANVLTTVLDDDTNPAISYLEDEPGSGTPLLLVTLLVSELHVVVERRPEPTRHVFTEVAAPPAAAVDAPVIG